MVRSVATDSVRVRLGNFGVSELEVAARVAIMQSDIIE
jgi:hypothetical protein